MSTLSIRFSEDEEEEKFSIVSENSYSLILNEENKCDICIVSYSNSILERGVCIRIFSHERNDTIRISWRNNFKFIDFIFDNEKKMSEVVEKVLINDQRIYLLLTIRKIFSLSCKNVIPSCSYMIQKDNIKYFIEKSMLINCVMKSKYKSSKKSSFKPPSEFYPISPEDKIRYNSEPSIEQYTLQIYRGSDFFGKMMPNVRTHLLQKSLLFSEAIIADECGAILRENGECLPSLVMRAIVLEHSLYIYRNKNIF